MQSLSVLEVILFFVLSIHTAKSRHSENAEKNPLVRQTVTSQVMRKQEKEWTEEQATNTY